MRRRCPGPCVSAGLLIGVLLGVATARGDAGAGETEFVRLEGGAFLMGDVLAASDAEPDERPPQPVRLAPFLVARHEVRWSLWKRVHDWAVTNGYRFDNGGRMGYRDGDAAAGHGEPPGPDHPVVQVSWYDAGRWCNARSEMEGLGVCYFLDEKFEQVWRSGNPDLAPAFVKWYATGYRLPTEAEWEYAAGGGHLVGGAGGRPVRYPGGPDADLVGWHRGNAGGGTRPVGTRRANALGLFDMGGNVWEWCFDWAGTPYAGVTPWVNPAGPATGKQRVLRGGSWNDPAYLMRTANRNGSLPVYLAVVAGFRPVRTAR